MRRHISSALFLAAVTAPLSALPLPAFADDDLQTWAQEIFEQTFGPEECGLYYETEAEIERTEIALQQDGWTETVTLFTIPCFSGAYNAEKAIVMHSESAGMRLASFAQPVVTAHFGAIEGDADEGPLLGIDITGFATATTLTNPEIDPETGQLVHHVLMRGIGDASESGTWDLTFGGYVLHRYQSDPTYNGEIDPVTVLDISAETPLR